MCLTHTVTREIFWNRLSSKLSNIDRVRIDGIGGFTPPPPSSPVPSIVTPDPQPLSFCCIADPPGSFFTIRTLNIDVYEIEDSVKICSNEGCYLDFNVDIIVYCTVL